MHKLRLLSILFLLPLSLLAQQKTKIILDRAETVEVDAKKDITYLRKPVFRQDGAILTCDSAVFYTAKNVFDAFRNVHINQADTINIYSDRLNYDGNTKNAHLTNNVRMMDRESTLTTNILDYNLGTKIGTYVSGGKIVNKDVTLTSKNGYYFSNTRDSYFRYNVVVVTPQTVIKSDTMRYNTLDNWAYFYGPTNIKGKDDNLYTENGAYNTRTQYAYFGKKNLYTQGSKSLKGDSLYYDGIAGYGKAVRNIIFRDTTDKTVLYGQLGYYYKIDQRTVVTKNAYIGMGTSDSIEVNKKLQPDTLWMGADTLETQMVLQKSLKLISSPILKKDNEMGDEDEKPEPKIGEAKFKNPVINDDKAPKAPPRRTKKDKDKSPVKIEDKNTHPPDSSKVVLPGLKDSLSRDSIPIIAEKIAAKLDSTAIKKLVPVVKDSLAKLKTDTALLKKAKETVATNAVVKAAGAKVDASGIKAIVDPKLLKKPLLKDTVPFNPADTIKTRAIKAYHNVRVYKSNMQARADSLFYTSADSTLRWYGSPILWAEGSQQTGDTIYLRLRNKQLNTSQVISKSFVVNVNADSARFNQIKGKLITGFFVEGKLNRMFVDGNAESVYHNREDNGAYTDMNQTVSSRIKLMFNGKEIDKIVNIKDTEGARTPIKELKEDVFLTGFVWKPELRPLSKKEVILGKIKPRAPSKKGPVIPGPKVKEKEQLDGKPLSSSEDEKDSKKEPAKSVKEAGKEVKEATKETKENNKEAKEPAKPAIKPAVPAPVKADSVTRLPAAPLKKQ